MSCGVDVDMRAAPCIAESSSTVVAAARKSALFVPITTDFRRIGLSRLCSEYGRCAGSSMLRPKHAHGGTANAENDVRAPVAPVVPHMDDDCDDVAAVCIC